MKLDKYGTNKTIEEDIKHVEITTIVGVPVTKVAAIVAEEAYPSAPVHHHYQVSYISVRPILPQNSGTVFHVASPNSTTITISILDARREESNP